MSPAELWTAERQQPAHDCKGDEKVQRSSLVSEMIWAEASECGDYVGHGDRVRSQVRTHVTFLHRVQLDIKVQYVDAYETEAHAETIIHEGRLTERVDVVEFPSLQRWLF